ncbi:MAG: FAD:protein FMN transferase [Dehalococcoidales bacterium]|nr:FAD:protein FMN transferase [Dehalococcoidales bacterium]
MNYKLSRRDFIKITAAGAGALALGAIGVNRLLAEPELKIYEETQVLLGTFVTIKAVDTDEKNARNMVGTTFEEIKRLSNIFSRFDSKSELYSLNKSGQIYGASDDLICIMKSSIQYSELTDGLFDITALPLLELNHESFNTNNAPPDKEAITEIKSLVGYNAINISGNDITLQKPGALITLDSIAVGYIVDKAAALLSQGNINNVLINGGGEIYPCGTKNDGELWKIGIANPRDTSKYLAVIDSSNWAISTSGDYEAYFTGDYLYNFIIDPRTGVSPTELASATVIAKDTLCADALSTACIVMGKNDALSMIENLPGTEALLVDKNMNCYRSSGFPVDISNNLYF